MQPLRIASLPTRPTAPTYLGGKGFTATEMKEAFDLLPSLIAERYNSLLEDIESGDVLDVIKIDGKTLRAYLAYILSEINSLKSK
jgi:hypothetical protein